MPRDSKVTLWYSSPGIHSLMWSFSFNVNVNCDLLLTNRIWQRWRNIYGNVFVIILYEIIINITIKLPSPLWLWEIKLLCCKLPFGKDHVLKSQGWPLVDIQLETEASNAAELNSINNHINRKWLLPQLSLRWDTLFAAT